MKEAISHQPVAQNLHPAFALENWESVEAAASGKTVNWYMWGGSEPVNNFVDEFYGTALQRRYDITLNRVPVADAVEFVNQLLSEKEAGVDPGSIDLVWINGENFATLKQADMLYGGWTKSMPNSDYVVMINSAPCAMRSSTTCSVVILGRSAGLTLST